VLVLSFVPNLTVAQEEPPPASGPAPGAAGSAVVLPPLVVEGQPEAEDPTAPVAGFVARSSAVGTKTGAPLVETPQSVSVITRDRMDAQGADSLASAVNYTPGVRGDASGLDTRGYGLQFRGFNDASDSTFYLNGLQLKGTAFASFLPLDPYGAERLEVMRGPSSVLYGQVEPGGLVNYVSKRPQPEPVREVELGYGSFDRYEGRFDLTGPVTEDRTLLYRVTGLARDSDTQVDYVDNDRVFLAPSLTWRPSEATSITLTSHYQRDRQGWAFQFYPAAGTVQPNPNGQIPTRRFTGEPSFDRYALDQYSIGWLAEHRFGEIWTVRQNTRYSRLENEQEGVFGLGLQADQRTYDRYGDSGDTELDAINLDNQIQAEFTTGPAAHTLLAGLDYQWYDYSDRGTEYEVEPIDIFDPVYGSPITEIGDYQDTDQRLRQTGLYVQGQTKLFDRVVLLLGGRHDWVDTRTRDTVSATRETQNAEEFTSRAGLVYLGPFGLAPYVSYAESFLPVLGTDASGGQYEPETGRQYEIGVRYQPPGWNSSLSLAAFDIVRENVLTQDPDDPLNQVQTGEIRSRGIEVEALASLADGLDLVGAWTLLDTEITASNVPGEECNRPDGVPEQMASAWLGYSFDKGGPLGGFGLGAGVRYYGSTYGDSQNSFKVDSATLYDAAVHVDLGRLSPQLDGVRLAVTASNLLDDTYVASCFNDSFGCFYGERRRVFASLRVRW
jgi:iron complex outermembrane receptor protein